MSKINAEKIISSFCPIQNGEGWILLRKSKGKQDKNNGYLGEKGRQ